MCRRYFYAKHGKLVFLFSGANQQAKDNHALSFLIDEIIKAYSQKQLVFDFEGSDQDGLARYYKGFGSKKNVLSGHKNQPIAFFRTACPAFSKKKMIFLEFR